MKENTSGAVASQRNEQYCVTVEGIKTDLHNVIIRFSVESLKEEPIASLVPTIEVSMNSDGRTQYQSLESYPEEVDNQEENMLHFGIHIIRITQATELTLKVLSLQDFENQKELPVDITVEGISLESYEQIELQDHNQYTNMNLSPIGLWIEDATIHGPELQDGMPKHDVYLVFQDGSRLGYSAAEYEEKVISGEELVWDARQVPYREQTYLSISFMEKIDLDKVSAIEIDGEEITVTKE